MSSWREEKTWLAELAGSLPGELKDPLEIAGYETEQFYLFTGREKPVFRFVCEEGFGESYIVETADPGKIVIRGGKQGILYGTYEVLFDLVCEKPLPEGIQKPFFDFRMLDSWDNPDGSIERGYAGRSLWFDEGRISYEPDRIRQLGRMLASVGINVLCINNVNADEDARSLIGEQLPLVSELASILRPFGVRLMISVDFSSPVHMAEWDGWDVSGDTELTAVPGTADPLDERVRRWWKNRAALVYQTIPDLAGFLVKADSEHRSGPSTYGRTHAQGANMLAEALEPYGGKVVWRAFVYNCRQDWRDTKTDRPCAAYQLYHPMDGSFSGNVILQVKNGPVDFQVCEPVSPLLLNMEKTKLSLELQITQEYTGHQIDLFAMPPVWRDIFDRLNTEKLCAIAGVSNLGRDPDWTGHPFAALNLFAFGRFAWNPGCDPGEVIRRWVRLSAYLKGNPQEEETLTDLLRGSAGTYEKYTSTLGLGWMVNPGEHYGPSPWGYEFQAWGTYNRADRNAVGIDRTGTGTGFLNQYSAEAAAEFCDPENCPDRYLLFFHRLPYTFRMQDGRTLIQRIYDDHFEGYEEVLKMQKTLSGLSLPDPVRTEVLERMGRQVENAREWRDVTNTFFYRLSGIPDGKGRRIYE